MSRNQKLFDQLTNLEDKYLHLLSLQFELLCNGESSDYLSNKCSNWWYTMRGEAEILEKLESKIIRLQKKLGITDWDSPVKISNEFASIFDENINYREHNKYIARLFKEKLDLGFRIIHKSDINISNIIQKKGHKPQKILMYQNKKSIKAIKNFKFPISFENIFKFIESNKILRFNKDLIAVEFINQKSLEIDKSLMFSLYPQSRIIVCSIPECFDEEIVKKGISNSLLNIKEINNNYNYKNGSIVQFYNFYINKTELIIEKQEYQVKRRKYRSGDKFSHSYKPKLGKTKKEHFTTISLC